MPQCTPLQHILYCWQIFSLDFQFTLCTDHLGTKGSAIALPQEQTFSSLK